MQDSYYDLEHRATAHLMELGRDRWLLTELQVSRYGGFRGQGHAGRLLARVIEDADQEGATLCLCVDPDGSAGALDYDSLKSFYERRGFVCVEEGAMVRPPNGQPADRKALEGVLLR